MHRKLMGYSAAQVARLLGLRTAASLSQWENGAKFPTAENLFRLSIIFRTYPNELYAEYFREQMKALRQKERELFGRQ